MLAIVLFTLSCQEKRQRRRQRQRQQQHQIIVLIQITMLYNKRKCIQKE